MTYANLGKEKDRDLIPLCWRHHEEYHKTYKKTNRRTTIEFIETKKAKLLARESVIPF